jgi:hypothetical protein
LATLLGAPRGFFIPYRHAGDVRPGRGYAALEPAFRRAPLEEALRRTESFAPRLLAFGGEPPAPRWAQDWFPGLDGAAAYALARALKPRRIVEVGSGHSTRFLARALRDEGLDGRILCIDPAPRAKLLDLPVEWRRATLREAGLDAFAELAAGDIAFFDSSHILMPGSDVDDALNRVLPALPAGVVAHFHDIFLPDDYPAEWAWRGYNEQQAVAPLLTGGGWEILWASRWVRTRMAERLAAGPLAALPLPARAWESSLWLRKLSG